MKRRNKFHVTDPNIFLVAAVEMTRHRRGAKPKPVKNPVGELIKESRIARRKKKTR
jgi:hypothetical protein